MQRRVLTYNQGAETFNLFIGGVSSTINTKALLAAKFTFAEGDVSSFEIVGDDIKANITNTSYDFIASAFASNLDITSLEETSGYLVDIGYRSFTSCSNLTSLKMVKIVSLDTQCLVGCSSLDYNDLVEPIKDLTGISGIQSADLSNGTYNPTYSFDSLVTLNVQQAFVGNLEADFSVLTNIAQQRGFRQAGVMNVDFSALEQNLDYGSAFGYNGTFYNINTSSVLNFKSSMETINGGSECGDLLKAKAAGVTVNYTL